MTTKHVCPKNDTYEHELDGDDCPCCPRVQAVEKKNGDTDWLIIHKRFDQGLDED